MSFPGGSDWLEIRMQYERPGFPPWVGQIPWRRAWQPTPVFLPGESPWTEKPGGLESMGLQSWTRLSMHILCCKLGKKSKVITHMVFYTHGHCSYFFFFPTQTPHPLLSLKVLFVLPASPAPQESPNGDFQPWNSPGPSLAPLGLPVQSHSINCVTVLDCELCIFSQRNPLELGT